MLFLGAGASVPMGIGDIENFTRIIIERTEGNLRNTIDTIQRILNSSVEFMNFRFNLEVLYSILDGFSNRWRALTELGPFPILMHNLLSNNNEFYNLQISQQEFSDFETIVETEIVSSINSYSYDRTRRRTAKNLYDDLFAIPIRSNSRFLNASGNNVTNVFNMVTTLNYDLVLELYSNDSVGEDRLSTTLDFFRQRGFNNNNPSMLDLTNILNQQLYPNNRIEYLKLHGSIDWWRGDDNNIYHDFSGQNPFMQFTERTIIYPIYEKYISREPFFTLYQYFRRNLLFEDIVIVIGYSFADISINNAFKDWLTFNNKARLLVISKKQNQPRIRNIFGNLMNRIEFLEDYFGEQNFTVNLENILVNSPQNI